MKNGNNERVSDNFTDYRRRIPSSTTILCCRVIKGLFQFDPYLIDIRPSLTLTGPYLTLTWAIFDPCLTHFDSISPWLTRIWPY